MKSNCISLTVKVSMDAQSKQFSDGLFTESQKPESCSVGWMPSAYSSEEPCKISKYQNIKAYSNNRRNGERGTSESTGKRSNRNSLLEVTSLYWRVRICNEDSKRHLQCHALPLVMEGVSFAELAVSYSFYKLQKQVREC